MSESSPHEDSIHRPVFTISVKWLRSGPKLSTSLNLCRKAHHPPDLASATIFTTARPRSEWSRTQNRALGCLQLTLSKWVYYSSISSATFPSATALDAGVPMPPGRTRSSIESFKLPSADFMRSLFKPIGELFFMGELQSLPFDWDENLRQRWKFWGAYFTNDPVRPCRIAIDPNWCCHDLEGSKRRDGIFGVLLHECIHAWLAIFSCSSSQNPCSEESCSVHHTEHTGLTGHGSAFIRLARHVQTVAQEHISPEIDLNIDVSFRFEESIRKSKRAGR